MPEEPNSSTIYARLFFAGLVDLSLLVLVLVRVLDEAWLNRLGITLEIVAGAVAAPEILALVLGRQRLAEWDALVDDWSMRITTRLSDAQRNHSERSTQGFLLGVYPRFPVSLYSLSTVELLGAHSAFGVVLVLALVWHSLATNSIVLALLILLSTLASVCLFVLHLLVNGSDGSSSIAKWLSASMHIVSALVPIAWVFLARGHIALQLMILLSSLASVCLYAKWLLIAPLTFGENPSRIAKWFLAITDIFLAPYHLARLAVLYLPALAIALIVFIPTGIWVTLHKPRPVVSLDELPRLLASTIEDIGDAASRIAGRISGPFIVIGSPIGLFGVFAEEVIYYLVMTLPRQLVRLVTYPTRTNRTAQLGLLSGFLLVLTGNLLQLIATWK